MNNTNEKHTHQSQRGIKQTNKKKQEKKGGGKENKVVIAYRELTKMN